MTPGNDTKKRRRLLMKQYPTAADLRPEDQADVLAIISSIHMIMDDGMAILAIHRVLERVRQRTRTEREYARHHEKVTLLTRAMSRN
jgi:hypothetical protein